MKIGIIGAGFIGRAVAQLALAAGHEVMLSNSRGPQSMSSVLSGIRGVQVGTAQDAAQLANWSCWRFRSNITAACRRSGWKAKP